MSRRFRSDFTKLTVGAKKRLENACGRRGGTLQYWHPSLTRNSLSRLQGLSAPPAFEEPRSSVMTAAARRELDHASPPGASRAPLLGLIYLDVNGGRLQFLNDV